MLSSSTSSQPPPPPETQLDEAADALSSIVGKLSIDARVFHSGALCGLSNFEAAPEYSHIHFLKRGSLLLRQPRMPDRLIDEPCLIFYCGRFNHQLISQGDIDPEIVCAEIDFGAGKHNPVTKALDELVILPFSTHPMAEAVAKWLFEEAFSKRQARLAVVDRLSEILVIELLRHSLENTTKNPGLIQGLADPHIGPLLEALHDRPEENWSLESMSRHALMSRSKFADRFRALTGQTPADYLSDWRLCLAQSYLKKGHEVSWVAEKVGYQSASSMARAFRKKLGSAPKSWQRNALASS